MVHLGGQDEREWVSVLLGNSVVALEIDTNQREPSFF